jgi:nucleoside recognition membrane protein YjiH
VRGYEVLCFIAIYLPIILIFKGSGFAMSIITALTICYTYVNAVLRTDLSSDNWSLLRSTVWVTRVAVLATGYWMFSETPAKIGRYVIVLAFVAIYALCENAAWRRKREIEKAANLLQESSGE